MHREIRHAKPRSYVPRGAVKTEERTNHGLRKKAKYLFFFFSAVAEKKIVKGPASNGSLKK